MISINAGDLYTKGNYQDFQRYPEVDIAMAADAEATLPALTEACKRLITADRQRTLQERGKKLAETHQNALDRARAEAAYAWDASPISTARMSAELWAQIKNEDWSLVSESGNVSGWPMRLWNFDKPYRHFGGSGGAGVGYGAPAAVGAALANKKRGRLSVTIQGDGDFMYAPGVWWTAAHHQDPAARGDAQQPCLPPGSDAPAADGGPAPARHHARAHRHDDRGPEHRFRKDRAGHGRPCAGTDRQSRTIWARRSSGRSRSSSAASRR